MLASWPCPPQRQQAEFAGGQSASTSQQNAPMPPSFRPPRGRRPPAAATRPLLPAQSTAAVASFACSGSSTCYQGRHTVRCRASERGDPGAQPSEQQYPAPADQLPGSNSAAGGLGGALARSDQRVLAICRAAVASMRPVWDFLGTLLPTLREAWALRTQLQYPSPGFVLWRTVQVLLVVAAFMAYVWAVDGTCSCLPRVIQWTQAHPGWLRQAWGGLVAGAAQRLAAT